MRKQTKATNIPPKVKAAVYDRDKGRCIICGQPGDPVAHYISRAQGGLGIEQNIVTLCWMCHQTYDQSHRRDEYRRYIKMYLQGKYPYWNENKLTYRKGYSNAE